MKLSIPKIFFKRHWLAIVGALVCGVIFVSPQVVLRLQLGPEFRGVILGGVDGELYYMRVQEVYEGNFKISSPGILEYKQLPYANTPLGEITAAMVGKLFGLQASEAIVAGDFIFPTLLFLVFYVLLYSLTSEKLLAFTSSAGILLASNLLLVPRNVFDLFFDLESIVVNVYNRPIHPQVSSLYFFGWLLVFLYRNFKHTPRPIGHPSQEGNIKSPLPRRGGLSGAKDGVGKTWSLVVSGILFGLLFYVYPYSWMMAVVFQSIMIVYLFWQKIRLTKNNSDRRSFSLLDIDWRLTKSLIVSFVIGLVVSIPYWMNFSKLASHPWYDSLRKFQGFYSTHEPVFSLLLVVDVVIISVLYILSLRGSFFRSNLWFRAIQRDCFAEPRNDSEQGELKSRVLTFASVFTLSAFILLNQQVITGIKFFPGHWHWYYIVPFSIFLLLFAFWNVFGKWPMRRRVVFVGATVMFLANGIISQNNYYRDSSPHAIDAQRYGPVYAWFNANTEISSVVLAEEPMSTWIPFYTSNHHYFTSFLDTLSLIPEERVRHDFFVRKYLEGVRSENVDEFINQKTPEFHYVLFGYWRRYQYGCFQCFPEGEIQKIKNEYLEFLKRDFHDEMKKYQSDYLVLDRARGKWNVEGMDFLEEKARVGDFIIYKIH